MKNWFIAFIVACVALTACDKMTTELEGKWQLKQVEQDGVMTPVDTVWYNFQTSLFMYQFYDQATDTYHYKYGYNYFEEEGEVRLELETDEKFLSRTDWKERTRTFKIDQVSRKSLILSSEGKKYYFDKF